MRDGKYITETLRTNGVEEMIVLFEKVTKINGKMKVAEYRYNDKNIYLVLY